MNRRNLLACVLGLVVVAWVAVPKALGGSDTYRRQTIVNDSNTLANDLHVHFEQGRVGGARLNPKDANYIAVGTVSGDGSYVDFAPPSFSIAGGGVSYLDYHHSDSNDYVIVDGNASYWTYDGNDIGDVKRQGQAWLISEWQYGLTRSTLTNDANAAQQYSGVQLWKDNDLANLNIDDCFIPTGVQVPGIPTEFVLLPGEEIELSFGETTPGTYLLALAEMRPESEPMIDPYPIYLATPAIPEPAGFTLVWFAGSWFLIRRRRKRAV